MDIHIKKIGPNPFKKFENGGKLNPDQVATILSSLERIGHFGSFPVRRNPKKSGKPYQLVCHHHTLEAMRKKHGSNFKVQVTVHKYDDEEMLLGMVRENLTQRAQRNEDTMWQIVFVRDYLKKKYKIKIGPQQVCAFINHGNPKRKGGGKIVSLDKVERWISIQDNLHPAIRKQVLKPHSERNGSMKITVAAAEVLSRGVKNKSEQLDVAKALAKEDPGAETNLLRDLVSSYKRMSKDTRSKVRTGQLSLSEATVAESIRSGPKEAKKPSKPPISAKRHELEDKLVYSMIHDLSKALKKRSLFRRTNSGKLKVALSELSDTIDADLKTYRSKKRIVSMM